MLALLCLGTAAGAGLLLWQRLNPSYVDTSVSPPPAAASRRSTPTTTRTPRAAWSGSSPCSPADLREQYEADLSQGGILDTYEQVSATTSYEVLDVGLQQVNEAQDTATLVVFGKYVVEVGRTAASSRPPRARSAR